MWAIPFANQIGPKRSTENLQLLAQITVKFSGKMPEPKYLNCPSDFSESKVNLFSYELVHAVPDAIRKLQYNLVEWYLMWLTRYDLSSWSSYEVDRD